MLCDELADVLSRPKFDPYITVEDRQQFFRLQEQEQLGGVWEPPVDVYETEEKWTVVVALPGVPSERMRYRLDGNCLTVVAERAIPSECSEGAIRRKELPHSRNSPCFFRSSCAFAQRCG